MPAGLTLAFGTTGALGLLGSDQLLGTESEGLFEMAEKEVEKGFSPF